MRYVRIDGKEYEVTDTYSCPFHDHEMDYCQHPEVCEPGAKPVLCDDGCFVAGCPLVDDGEIYKERWLIHARRERDALRSRVFRLERFIESDRFEDVDEAQRLFMLQQRNAMELYLHFLEMRVSLGCQSETNRTEDGE